jgi:hypothetical protein
VCASRDQKKRTWFHSPAREESNCCGNASQSEINQIINEGILNQSRCLAAHLLSRSRPAWHDWHPNSVIHTCTHSTLPPPLHILSNFFLCIHAKVIRVLCYPIRVGRWTCGRERQKDQSSSLDYLLVLHSLYVINWCNFPASHSVHRLSRCHRRCAGLLPVAAGGRRADCIDATAPRCAFGSRQFNWRAAVSRVIRPLISIPFLFFFLLIILLPLFLVSFYISARAGLRECPRALRDLYGRVKIPQKVLWPLQHKINWNKMTDIWIIWNLGASFRERNY